MQRTATCSCGALQAICQAEPGLVSMCHCIACQKRTGAPFGLAAFHREDRVRIRGASSVFTRSSDTGFGLAFHFCPACGSTVFWRPARKPGVIAVAVGAFGDPAFPAPSQEVFTDCRHAWLAALDAPRT